MDRGSDASLFKSVYILPDVLIGCRPSERSSIFQLVFIYNFIVVFICMSDTLTGLSNFDYDSHTFRLCICNWKCLKHKLSDTETL